MGLRVRKRPQAGRQIIQLPEVDPNQIERFNKPRNKIMTTTTTEPTKEEKVKEGSFSLIFGVLALGVTIYAIYTLLTL